MTRKQASAAAPVGLALALLSIAVPAAARDSDETSLYEQSPATGTSIPVKIVFGGRLPLRKTWQELSADEREFMRSHYNSMPDDDEPPYPRSGLISIYKPISKLQNHFAGKGEVEMYVTVEPSGKPRSVSVYKSPTPELARDIASVLMLTEYKPAVCKGQPCTMEFPLKLNLTVGF